MALLEDCREIATQQDYQIKSRIHLTDLLEYRERIRQDHAQEEQTLLYHCFKVCGFRNQSEQLLRVLDRAAELVQDRQSDQNHYFHYMDFFVSTAVRYVGMFLFHYCFCVNLHPISSYCFTRPIIQQWNLVGLGCDLGSAML